MQKKNRRTSEIIADLSQKWEHKIGLITLVCGQPKLSQSFKCNPMISCFSSALVMQLSERGRGVSGWVESITIAVDPLCLLASMSGAVLCSCANVFHISQPGVLE